MQFSGINYIDNVEQPLLLFPKVFHYYKQKLCNHKAYSISLPLVPTNQ